MAKFSSLDITRLLFSLKRELYKSMSSLPNNFKWSIGNETTNLLLCSLKLIHQINDKNLDPTIRIGYFSDLKFNIEILDENISFLYDLKFISSQKLSDYTILIGELRDQMDKWKSGLQKYYKLN
jgi:hypothetical protein